MSSGEKCPVDHSARATWGGVLPSEPSEGCPASSSSSNGPRSPDVPSTLPTDREVSSIPRKDGENWVYPSQAQFFAAMARKQHNPRESDMKVVVPIHNAVNERAWKEVMEWENGQGGGICGGVKLVSFKGRPRDLSPKARWRTLLGYQAPFDRHDWVVDRCGTRMRYVIDFYTGKSTNGSNVSFFLDVRPSLDNWEGWRMRATRLWDEWIGGLPQTTASAQSQHPQTRSTSDKSSQ